MTGRPADNPFASRRIDRLEYRIQGDNVQSIAERLRLTGGSGSVIGPHGSGKTTLLENLAGRLDGQPVWVRLDAQTPRPVEAAVSSLPRPITKEHVVLIDGAEQLGPCSWWRLRQRIRNARTIIITSHSPGRLPTLHECTTSQELLTDLVDTLAPGMAETLDLDELFLRHEGNIRLCFRELYDVWARQKVV